MAHRASRALVGFFLAAFLVAVAALVFALSQPRSAPPPLPNPNGYDELVKASHLLHDKTSDFPTMPEGDLAALVRTNTEALRSARAALALSSQVPLDYSPTNAVVIPELAGFKRLAQAFAAEARLAELEHRPGDAAEAYLANLRLGQAVSHGGLIIHSLVGVAIQAIGSRGLELVAPRLDAKQSREAAGVVKTCLARQETITEVSAREQDWVRRVFGLRGQIARLLSRQSLKQSEQRAGAKLTAEKNRMQALLKLLNAQAAEPERSGAK